jgi:hypothetical protein
MEGLQVLGFDPRKVRVPDLLIEHLPISDLQVMAHPRVIEWSRTLQVVQSTE